jgi:hypothetical protein
MIKYLLSFLYFYLLSQFTKEDNVLKVIYVPRVVKHNFRFYEFFLKVEAGYYIHAGSLGFPARYFTVFVFIVQNSADADVYYPIVNMDFYGRRQDIGTEISGCDSQKEGLYHLPCRCSFCDGHCM